MLTGIAARPSHWSSIRSEEIAECVLVPIKLLQSN
jgi:hypothetical protein